MENQISFLDQAESLLGGGFQTPTNEKPLEEETKVLTGDDALDAEEEFRKAEEERAKAATKQTKADKVEEKVEETKKDEKKDKPAETEPPTGGEGTEGGDESGDNVVKILVDALAERNGWDTSELTYPETPEDFLDYLSSIVTENSKPTFASPEVEEINQFVANGGDIRNLLALYSEGGDYDLNSTKEQQRAVADLLKRQGWEPEEISDKIAKYEEAGLLYDEAELAVKRLTKIKEKEKEDLAKKAEQEKQQAIESQRQFVKSVESEINSLKDIRGIAVSEKERKQLLDYMLKPTKTGQTQFVIDYQSSVHNFIESAYWTLFKDKVISSAKQSGTKTAFDQLKDKMTNPINPKDKGTFKTPGSSQESIWKTLS